MKMEFSKLTQLFPEQDKLKDKINARIQLSNICLVKIKVPHNLKRANKVAHHEFLHEMPMNLRLLRLER
jgi:hypothetical protein